MVENSLGRIYVDKRKNEGIYADGRGADEMTWEESEAKENCQRKLHRRADGLEILLAGS